MTTDTITSKLHAKADADLRKKLEESTEWVWAETGHNAIPPKIEEHEDIKNELKKCNYALSDMPWIGAVMMAFRAVAFAYLRDKWRNRYVAEFMGKVELMAQELKNLA